MIQDFFSYLKTGTKKYFYYHTIMAIKKEPAIVHMCSMSVLHSYSVVSESVNAHLQCLTKLACHCQIQVKCSIALSQVQHSVSGKERVKSSRTK